MYVLIVVLFVYDLNVVGGEPLEDHGVTVTAAAVAY